jgi:plastocyanin
MQPGRTTLAAAVICGVICVVPAQAATITITVKDLVFMPAAAAAKVGDTIVWDNKDVLQHTATATDKMFDVLLPPGKSGRFVVKKAGTFDYFCKFHPNMKAKVTVTP